MDSGAGQCMTSCSEAFHTLHACAVLVIGVGGSMPAHGVGTACFIGISHGIEYIFQIHNCLLCHGEDGFNLLSVSQILRDPANAVAFRSNASQLEIRQQDGIPALFDLQENDGLYEMRLAPLYRDDCRVQERSIDLTLRDDPRLWGQEGDALEPVPLKSPTKLGRWHSKMLWMSTKMAPMTVKDISSAYDADLTSFCDSYFVPPSQPAARRTYKVNDEQDMAELSLRFMGLGTDRLVHTLERSRGLNPTSKKKGETVSVVPPHNFPQGRWKSGKAPKVSKDKVKFLHKASIAEVVFTDTFETDDGKYRYGQAFVDYRSRYGDIQPLKSRKKIGWAFAEFCCRHFKPLILVSDNIAENAHGNLKQECHKLNIKSAFSCPYTPQQNYSENYLGRVTAMASFAMVLAGAPIFMWRWAISCAAFINNISATYYSKEKVWAVPYELLHGEPFPDVSIVVPFGCAALILLEKDDRKKFHSTCSMVIFIHYAQDHPLYTYAFFSPRTKRVIFRQDCIFLPEIFPMRETRVKVGLLPEGENLMVYKPRPIYGKSRMGSDEDEVKFATWRDHDPLPSYTDDITGHSLISPQDDTLLEVEGKPEGWPSYLPAHPSFGSASSVPVSRPWGACSVEDDVEDTLTPEEERMFEDLAKATDKYEAAIAVQPEAAFPDSERVDKDKRVPRQKKIVVDKPSGGETKKRRPAKERWFYEPVLPAGTPMLASFTTSENPGVLGISSDSLLPDFGPTEDLPGLLEFAEDCEGTAWELQGVVFKDNTLGWCKVTGWGVDLGVNMIYYAPVGQEFSSNHEHHVSLAEILTVIRQQPVVSKISDYRPSRQLESSGSSGPQNKIMRILSAKRKCPMFGTMFARRPLDLPTQAKTLSSKIITKILKAHESMFKYGTFIPRSDREAEKSPEAPRWRSGRTLEWLRLREAKTFETDWTWDRVRSQYPDYKKEDIGYMFYVYDYKYSGEHRVRLVFDGSRQSETTYSVTYAPTVRAESVRLFHLYAVEYGWPIQQYDVPQAFLRSDADCTIFVYPPKGQSDFPGQLLKLAKMLYGSKQAAALWFNLLNTFLIKLGFVASSMDPCFYRRVTKGNTELTMSKSDAIIILHVDDMRVAAPPDIIKVIHDQLYDEFQITTSDCSRFLGMDTEYNLEKGVFKMHMATYIQSTLERFQEFDLSKGVPYRELVGSLLWIVLCVMGPELLRVKDLAKRSHKYTLEDYNDAVKTLHRIVSLKQFGIIFRRGAAGSEYIPANTRHGGGLENVGDNEEPYSIGDEAMFNELEENNLYKLDPDLDDASLDIIKTLAPTNDRFTMVAYSDASFAVGETKQSISGFVILINGTPILWGSLKQTIVVDSTCSAEYVAASICCKQIMQAENMVQFLDFTCPKPYKMYTDSEACMKIANNGSKLGMVRHLEIRYHLVRCIVLSGDIVLSYCITEEMLADLFTKIVTSAQDKRLAIRFYNDCVDIVD